MLLMGGMKEITEVEDDEGLVIIFQEGSDAKDVTEIGRGRGRGRNILSNL